MAKGGGAWKVAYADFVTAMMAFFLVMWICGQDQKTKKAVANYFSNPNGVTSNIASKPTNTGAMFEGSEAGSVPNAETVAAGRGRGVYSSKNKGGRVTNLVNNWLHADAKALDYWRKQAKQQRDSARQAEGPDAKVEVQMKVATRQLALQLKDELTRDIPAQAKGLHKDLLTEITADVNWTEIAEDLLWE